MTIILGEPQDASLRTLTNLLVQLKADIAELRGPDRVLLSADQAAYLIRKMPSA